jgi:stage III sporulation protein AB
MSMDLEYSVTPAMQLLEKSVSKDLDFITCDSLLKLSPANTILSDEENERIGEFLYSLGKTDVKTQMKSIASFKEYINKSKMKYSETYKSKSKIYITFGLCIGIFVSLILV